MTGPSASGRADRSNDASADRAGSRSTCTAWRVGARSAYLRRHSATGHTQCTSTGTVPKRLRMCPMPRVVRPEVGFQYRRRRAPSQGPEQLHRRPAEPARPGQIGFRTERVVQHFLDVVLGEQREPELGRQCLGKRGLASSGRPGDQHDLALGGRQGQHPKLRRLTAAAPVSGTPRTRPARRPWRPRRRPAPD